jgi:hypothetical protein
METKFGTVDHITIFSINDSNLSYKFDNLFKEKGIDNIVDICDEVCLEGMKISDICSALLRCFRRYFAFEQYDQAKKLLTLLRGTPYYEGTLINVFYHFTEGNYLRNKINHFIKVLGQEFVELDNFIHNGNFVELLMTGRWNGAEEEDMELIGAMNDAKVLEILAVDNEKLARLVGAPIPLNIRESSVIINESAFVCVEETEEEIIVL